MTRQDERLPPQSPVVLVDVDGTLAGKYLGERRPLRPGAVQALRTLAEIAPVFLWSIAGRENGERLLREYPELRPYVAGTFGKDDIPRDRLRAAYCLDDEEIDDVVLDCVRFIVSTYDGGEKNDGSLLEAANVISAAIRKARG